MTPNYGFNLTPELLAELAARSFRPPQIPPMMPMPQQGMGMQMMPMPGQQQPQGFGLNEGMGMLGGAFRGFGGWGGTPNGNPNDNRPFMAGGIDPRLSIDPLTGLSGNLGLLGPI